MVQVVVPLLPLPALVLAVPLQVVLPRRLLLLRKRRKQVCLTLNLLDFVYPLITIAAIEKEESDEDMGFGLFD